MSSLASQATSETVALKQGQVFTCQGHRWTVLYVTHSRAHCVCRLPVTVEVIGRDGTTRRFTANKTQSMDISPNACVEALS